MVQVLDKNPFGDKDNNTEPVLPSKKVKKIRDEDLYIDQDWISFAKTLDPVTDTIQDIANVTPQTDEEYARQLIKWFGQFHYNLIEGGETLYDTVGKWSDEEQLAFAKAYNKYEQLEDFTAKGFYRFGKGLVSDPTTYIGVGFLARIARATILKEGAKQFVNNILSKESAKAVAASSATGGVYTGAYDVIHQNVKINTDMQKQFGYGQFATSVGIGTTIGGILGGTTYYGVRALRNSGYGKLFNKPETKVKPEKELKVKVDKKEQTKPKVKTEEKPVTKDQIDTKPEKPPAKFDESQWESASESVKGALMRELDLGGDIRPSKGHPINLKRIETTDQLKKAIYDMAENIKIKADKIDKGNKKTTVVSLEKAVENAKKEIRKIKKGDPKPKDQTFKTEGGTVVNVTKLSESLRKAKPRYNFGTRNIKLTFTDDVAKALYIVSGPGKSKAHDQYIAFLKEAGVKDIVGEGKKLRESIKSQAKIGDNAKVEYIRNVKTKEATTRTDALKGAKTEVEKLNELLGVDKKKGNAIFQKLIGRSRDDVTSLKDIQARATAIYMLVTDKATQLFNMANSKPLGQFTNIEKAKFIQLKEELDAVMVLDTLYSRNFSRALGNRRITRGQQTLEKMFEQVTDTTIAGKAIPLEQQFNAIHKAVLNSKGKDGNINVKLLRENTSSKYIVPILQHLNTYRTGALISAASTQQAAIIGNLINMFEIPITRMLGARKAGLHLEAKIEWKALSSYHLYFHEARKQAVEAFARGETITDPFKSVVEEVGKRAPNRRRDRSYARVTAARVLKPYETASDAMIMYDEFTKTLAYRSYAYAEAFIKYKVHPDYKGKSDKELHELAIKYVKDITDPDTGRGLDQRIIKIAQEMTYTSDITDTAIGKIVNLGANSMGGIGRLLIFAFVKAPMNIISRGLEFTPFSKIVSQRQLMTKKRAKITKQTHENNMDMLKNQHNIDPEIRDLIKLQQGEYKEAALRFQQLKSRKAIGYSVFALASVGGFAGKIDSNPSWNYSTQEKRVWRSGNRQQTFNIGNKSYSYRNLEPLATVISAGSELGQFLRQNQHLLQNDPDFVKFAEGLALTYVSAIANATLNKSYMVSLNQMVEAFSGDESMMGVAIRQWASTLVPQILRDIAKDKHVKESNTILNAMARKLPFLNELLGTNYDIFGRPVKESRPLGEVGKTRMGGLPVVRVEDNLPVIMQELSELTLKNNRASDFTVKPNLGIQRQDLDFRQVFDDPAIDVNEILDMDVIPDTLNYAGKSVYSKYMGAMGVSRDPNTGLSLYETVEAFVTSPEYEAMKEGNIDQRPLALERISDIFTAFKNMAKAKLSDPNDAYYSPEYVRIRDENLQGQMDIKLNTLKKLNLQ